MGLYYIRENQWFSIDDQSSRKSACPGDPNPTIGFHSFLAWLQCGTEVFRVFAKGKGDGATITDQDTLMFYVPIGKEYVQFLNDKVATDKCPFVVSGNQVPPSNDAFDHCVNEGVEITIFD